MEIHSRHPSPKERGAFLFIILPFSLWEKGPGEEVKSFGATFMKPKLLLHICCAPDEAWVVHTLNETYELRCFFCNPNIQPVEEYEKRLSEAHKTAAHFSVPFDAEAYDPASWETAVKDLTETPEGGARCEQCFLLRLRRTAQFCASIHWPGFTTVMSISPHKKIDMLNKAGNQAAGEFNVAYGLFNFKKNDGFVKSIRLSKDLGLYRQDYCGCRLSKAEREERKKRTSSPALLLGKEKGD
jgi:predicted adenine nucleotide alpha hydrolase (AANH) superfamily ATPase